MALSKNQSPPPNIWVLQSQITFLGPPPPPPTHTHIDSVSKKANQTLEFLKRSIKIHIKDLKFIVYTTLLRPQLEYASKVWSPHTATYIAKLEAVQRRSACWATRDYQRTSSETQMLQDLNWRTLEQWQIDSGLTVCTKSHMI